MSLEYSKEFELLLKQEGEKSECYAIMHINASNLYSIYSGFINMPVIVLSSFIGLFTALQLFPHQNIILGCLGIGVGILKTIDSFFDITKKAETHRLIALRYSKLSKLIQVQLSLPKNSRMEAKDFYLMITNDLTNLRDSEPLIPHNIELSTLFEAQTTTPINNTRPTAANNTPFENMDDQIDKIDKKDKKSMTRFYNDD